LLNFLLISLFSKSTNYALEQMLKLKFFILPLALGFSIQVLLFLKIKEFMKTINSLGRVMVVKEATWATGTPFLQKEGVAITVSLRGEVYFTKEADAG